MDINDYQLLTARTENFNLSLKDRTQNCLLGLSGETGEVLELFKKYYYQGHTLDINKLFEEIGDVMWYIARLADTYNLSLNDICENNINKLKDRYPNGFDKDKSVNRKDK